jgi:hypothetical protein
MHDTDLPSPPVSGKVTDVLEQITEQANRVPELAGQLAQRFRLAGTDDEWTYSVLRDVSGALYTLTGYLELERNSHRARP